MSIPIFFPIPRTRKGIKILMAVLGTLCLAGALIVFILWSADQKTLRETGQADFNTLAQSELRDGMFVTGSIDIAIDWYAEKYETGYFKERASDNSEALYYLIPIYNADGFISYFITYEAKPMDFEAMEKIVAQTWSDNPLTEKITIENGEIRKLSNELQQYMRERIGDETFYENGSFIDWCAEYNVLGTSDLHEIESRFTPYIICSTPTAGTDITVAWFLLCMGILCFIFMLVMIFFKGPIKGVIDTPPREDFSKVRAMEPQSEETENQNGYNG